MINIYGPELGKKKNIRNLFYVKALVDLVQVLTHSWLVVLCKLEPY